MPWHAVDAIDDAITVTRTFLFPFEFRRWLVLAIIVFFLGWGGSGAPGSMSNVSNVATSVGPGVGGVSGFLGLAVVALVLVLLLIGVILAAIGAIMRFVFLDALRTGDVRVRAPFKRWFRPGLRLFGFVVGVFLVIGAPVLFLVLGTVALGLEPTILLFLFPIAVLVGLGIGIVLLLTYEFVVPTMMLGDGRVIAGWRRFFTTLKREWKQFAVYLVVRWILGLVVGIISAVALVLIALPFLFVGGAAIWAGFLLGFGLTPVVLAILVVLGLPILIAVFVLGLFVQVVVQTFFGYYALLVLGEVNPDLDLIPERRRAIHEASGGLETAGD